MVRICEENTSPQGWFCVRLLIPYADAQMASQILKYTSASPQAQFFSFVVSHNAAG